MTDHDISGHEEDSPETSEGDGFDTLGLRPELLKTINDLGYEEPTPIQLPDHPAPPRRPRPAGSGGDGHRQDCGVRAAGAADDRHRRPRSCRSRSSSCRPASWPCRSARRSSGTAASSASRSPRSTAASRSSGSCKRSIAASTSSWPLPAGHSTTSAAARCTSMRSGP